MSRPPMKFPPLILLLTAPLAWTADVSDISPVWAGHRVRFALLSHGDHQFVAFYDAERRMTLAHRGLPDGDWSLKTLDSNLAWDSHNAVTMALDRENHLHVSGNMHNVPLVYFRGELPFDIASLRPVHRMTGEREKNVTYPVFLHGADDALVFNHRDGRSGNGSTLYNIYDEKSQSWSRLINTPLFDGRGKMNAYPRNPLKGPDGFHHMSWVWRDSPMAETNHDLSYVRSRDLITWETGDGRRLDLPLTLSSPGTIVDPIPTGGGMINGSGDIGFDPSNRPVIAYHKYDAQGHTQIHLARLNGGKWELHTLTDWKHRWEISGGGTITPEVAVDAPGMEDGVFSITIRYPDHSGTYRLDPDTLVLGGKLQQANRIPEALRVPTSPFPGMVVNWASDMGKASDGRTYRLRWESLPANRDKARPKPWPEPVMLKVIATP
jgi:hypothetical protein